MYVIIAKYSSAPIREWNKRGDAPKRSGRRKILEDLLIKWAWVETRNRYQSQRPVYLSAPTSPGPRRFVVLYRLGRD